MEFIEREVELRDYRKLYKFKLLYDLDELISLLDSSKVFAFDTETSSLDYDKIELAGFSFSLDGNIGYYVPIGHSRGKNADRSLLDYIVEQIKIKKVWMFNKKFDLNVLEISCGYKLGNCYNILDAQALVWLRDTDVKMPSLGLVSRHYLGIDQPKFSDLISEGSAFNYLLPEEAFEYAALDAICTFNIAKQTLFKFPELKGIFKIDNLSIEAVRQSEHDPVNIDGDFLKKERDLVESELRFLRRNIIEYVGYEFNINSNEQLAKALRVSGVHLTEKTKTGRDKVAIDVIEKFTGKFPKMLVEYSKKESYLGSYVKPLIRAVEDKKPVRFSFNAVNAPTGRISAGSDKKNPYFIKMNVQSVTKPVQVARKVCQSDNFITGYDIDDSAESDYYAIETGGDIFGVRKAFVPDTPEEVWVSVDYMGEELRIVTNLSNEPVWIKAFLNNEDIHMQTAIAVFGPNATKNQRKIAKIINFLWIYGGSEYSLAKKLNISLLEARSYLNIFEKTLIQLVRWKAYINRKATKTDIYTFLGRPRRMARYFKAGTTKKYRAFGYRTSVNTSAQGSGADFIRLSLGRILKWRLRHPIEAKYFRPKNNIHDEINFSVHQDFLGDFYFIIKSLMEFKFEQWQIPMLVDVSVGRNWAECIPYSYENKVWSPVGEFIKQEESADDLIEDVVEDAIIDMEKMEFSDFSLEFK